MLPSIFSARRKVEQSYCKKHVPCQLISEFRASRRIQGTIQKCFLTDRTVWFDRFADLETGQVALKASMKVVRGHIRWQENKRLNPAGFHRYDTVLVLQCP
jgi:hypothetical protein